jgi:large subunit ribosomal protein L17
MRHQKASIKLNRTGSHRNAMFRNMVTSLFKHERIRTTDAKAKELKRWADHLITLAKHGGLHARRQALSIIREKKIVHQLFEMAPERFGNINGGYTRVVKLGYRPGDAARISMVELIDFESQEKIKTPKKKTKIPSEKNLPETPEINTEAPASEVAAETEPDEIVKDDTFKANPEKPESTSFPDTSGEEASPEKKETDEPGN